MLLAGLILFENHWIPIRYLFVQIFRENQYSQDGKSELIDLGLILCTMGGFGLVLNACVCLNGMYSCIPCSFCKFTQIEPSSRPAQRQAQPFPYTTTNVSRLIS